MVDKKTETSGADTENSKATTSKAKPKPKQRGTQQTFIKRKGGVVTLPKED